jgi:PAS domain S-box-containing protein
MATPLRKTGIGLLGDFPWGTHFCHFFETKQDLLDTLLPYFAAGLEGRELCMWLVAEPLTTGEAESALRRSVPDLDRHLTDGSIEIRSACDWYLGGDGLLDLGRVVRAWDEKLEQALARGFAGMRVNASVAWLSRKDWRTFSEYEARFNESIAGKRLVALCTYPLATSGAAEILDVAHTHQFALAKRNGGWKILETAELREARDEIRRLNEELQQRVVERTRQLGAINEELRARNRQQSAVAALGQTAIRARDLSALIDEAAVVAAETLGTDYSAVLELLPSGEELLLRAGVGWKEGLVGRHTVPTGMGTPAGLILRSDTPIVVPDLRQEKRFTSPPSLVEHGVISAMDVLIRGRASPWGTLCVHTTRPRSFSPDDVGFLQSVANVLALAVERDEVERAQQREKETLQAIFDNIPVMISSYDASGRLLRVNREWERTLGWRAEEAQQVDMLAEAYPDPERRQEVLEFIRRAERRWVDFTARARDGRAIDASWARFRLSDGSVIGFGIDISERKQAEEALRESEARFRQLAESIDEVFWLANADLTEMLYVSPAYREVFGRSCESLYRDPRSWLEAVHPEDRERVWRVVDKKSARGAMDETYRVVRPDGSIRWIRDRGFAIRDASGEAYRFAGVAEDITDEKRGEEERARLLESESRARAEAEGALERLRAIESITDAALSYLGLDDLLRELLARLRSTLQAEIASVRLIDDGGKELYARAIDGIPLARVAGIGIPIDAVRLDAPFMVNEIQPPAPGRDDWFAKIWTAMGMPLRAGMSTPLVVAGKPIGLVGVTSTRAPFTEADLHLLQVVADRVAPAIERGRLLERVRAGRERQNVLSRRLLTAQEEERRRIAVELHDDLGQVLTAVKINLESLERLAGATPAPAQLKSAIGCVDEAMQRVRDLALDLRPSVLDDLGLPAALRWYVDRFARDAHLEAHLSIGVVPRLDPGVETACFRVAQEAMTNVARHAQARRVWLDLHVLAEGLELGIRDDGIGFDVAAARERAALGASMGLLGMQEHVSLVGGAYEVRSAPGGGTRLRARFPVGEKPRKSA